MDQFIWGNEPRFLLCSGMHGDEYQTCDLLREYVENNKSDFKNFVYIPKLSPSAYELKTRYNQYGHDLNRSFVPNISDLEAIEITKFLSKFKFDLCLDFHEDFSQEKDFYVCDSGDKTWEFDTKELDIDIFNGIEDPNDPLLQVEVKDGYVHDKPGCFKDEDGFITHWMYVNNICKRTLTFELPMGASLVLKRQIIQKMIKFTLDRGVIHPPSPDKSGYGGASR